MKRWSAIILCLAVLPIEAALAQQPDDHATKEDVQELLDVTHYSRERFAAIMGVITKQLPAMGNEVLIRP
jgi:hypothetical protein